MKNKNISKKCVGFLAIIILLVLTISFVSAEWIQNSDKGLIKTTITTSDIKPSGFLDNLFSILRNLFTISTSRTSYEQGEIINVLSGFEVDNCQSTSVEISLTKVGSTFPLDTSTINLGSIYQQSITAKHEIDTSSLSAGTYILKDYWLCAGAFPIVSVMGSPNPSTKTITITEKISTCTENWNCNNWGLCPSGVQYRTCTDSNSCGTTFDKPSTSQSCDVPLPPGTKTCVELGTDVTTCKSRGDCVYTRFYSCKSLADATCSGVMYETGCDKKENCEWEGLSCKDISPGEVPTNLDAVIYDIVAPNSVEAGEEVKVKFKVKNKGDAGTYLFEAGIIPESTAEDWGFIILGGATGKDTECCEGQPNIFAGKVKLDVGEIKDIEINIDKSPYSGIADLCYDNTYWGGAGVGVEQEIILYMLQ